MRPIGLVAIFSALTLAGCSIGSSEPAEPVDGDSLDIALFTEPHPAVLPVLYGVDNYGDDFELAISVDQNVTTFDSHKPVVETSQARDVEVMATSVSAILDARQQGEDLRIFCPYVSMDDFVLAGGNGVNAVGQLFEPTTRVGIDSPGGAGAIVLNALLGGVGETRDIPDILNPLIIESSGDRAAEWAAGNVDATVIHEAQYDDAEAQVDRPVRIATLYENAPDFVKAAQAADAGWLDDNRELAARYCATTLRAMAALKGDFALFQTAVDEYVETPPSAKGMQDLFGLINEYPFWTEEGGLSEESMQYMIDLSSESGVLAEPIDAADVVDRATLDRAVELADLPAG